MYHTVRRIISLSHSGSIQGSPADQNSDVSITKCLKEANNDESILTGMGTQSGWSFQGLLNTIIH